MRKKLAIITSHPIQYNAPLFKLLNERDIIELKVFYTWGESVLQNKFDPGFGKEIQWDIPLLNGYDHEFLENVAVDKGSHHFNGIDNPDIVASIESYQPDALLVYGWSFKSHLKVLRHFKNKEPVFFRGDSTLLDDTSFFSSIKRRIFLTWLYRYIDIAFYVGKSNYAYFRNAGLKHKQLVFAPHAIENERFICSTPVCLAQADRLRDQLNIPADHFVFLFAGKLEPKKDPELLLNAFIDSGFEASVHLVIVGNGVLEDQIKAVASNNKQIHVLDFKNQMEMPAVYQMADVFVLPSKGPGETWGLAVNEAMANGKPVIVSDKCGCAADLIDSCNGFVFQSGNKIQLKQLMLRMHDKRSKLTMLGEKSKTMISSYSFLKVAEAIEGTIKNLNKEINDIA